MRVVDHLNGDDLLLVSSVSRELHALVEPTIYQTISWTWNPIPLARVYSSYGQSWVIQYWHCI